MLPYSHTPLLLRLELDFSHHQIFPFILNRKPATFSFSEAPEKNRRAKGFSLPS